MTDNTNLRAMPPLNVWKIARGLGLVSGEIPVEGLCFFYLDILIEEIEKEVKTLRGDALHYELYGE